MIKTFFNLVKNRVFLIALCIINTIIFLFAFAMDNIDLMLLAVASYASVLLGLEYNRDFPNDEEEEDIL